MTRQEFLEGLDEALMDAPSRIRQDNLRFYDSYIEEEKRKGRTEEEIMDDLGEPSWIANTILEAAAGDTEADVTAYDVEVDLEKEDLRKRLERFKASFQEKRNPVKSTFSAILNGKAFKATGGLASLIIVIAVILVILVVGSIFGTIFRLLFWILTKPIFWVIGGGFALYQYIKYKRKK